MSKYLAEFLGTFTLALVVLFSSSAQFPVPTPVLAAVVVGIFVYTIGYVSGAQLNPAITLGAWSCNKMKTNDVIYYVISQFLGAWVALGIYEALGRQPVAVAVPTLTMGFAEVLGTATLAFGIASVVYGKVDKAVNGFVIGGSLLAGVAIAGSMGSAGVINPAVSLALGLFNPIYVIGQVAGGVSGFWLYKIIIKEK